MAISASTANENQQDVLAATKISTQPAHTFTAEGVSSAFSKTLWLMKACLLLVAAVLLCRWKLRVASSTMDCGRDLKLDAWFHSQMLELWTPSMQFLPIEQALIDSPLFSTYFDAQGNWISEPPIPKTSLEDFVTTIPPGEEKYQFLRFIRKILTWDQEVRATANEIIPDEWLMRLL
ncbi:hypothetical protein DTO013E5_5034 [Penicillium roqueforti]|uniref:uncharacterized protein n=1 Tax=Penicillium roqueforti TaxID=5082 RepID=UPI00190A350D|nr:uncharacterized protein LCP9604111_5714 [Penicillium roqueforti]KAF9248005.1 hypothetical protein LCP9604111_5714 [Penicillium roqueforti]KAI1834342.1 hypothetical protein CBS147337_4632 [Penicillium roqueforti]KAI2686130.1 hypothetical protein CBS147355_1617 [Penicillium roqueforti]KAI2714870.1 hypothetical protein CBS147318_6447 [Penicillium roqueforti]KAI2742911.1 hypothetical protein DTO012A1_3573 [Penicillium roqueforti]